PDGGSAHCSSNHHTYDQQGGKRLAYRSCSGLLWMAKRALVPRKERIRPMVPMLGYRLGNGLHRPLVRTLDHNGAHCVTTSADPRRASPAGTGWMTTGLG